MLARTVLYLYVSILNHIAILEGIIIYIYIKTFLFLKKILTMYLKYI